MGTSSLSPLAKPGWVGALFGDPGPAALPVTRPAVLHPCRGILGLAEAVTALSEIFHASRRVFLVLVLNSQTFSKGRGWSGVKFPY